MATTLAAVSALTKALSGHRKLCLQISDVRYVGLVRALQRPCQALCGHPALAALALSDLARCSMLQREHELKRRERQAAQEEALAEALAQQQTAEEARLREIQQICESDPMLRELQEKIKVCCF